jgi:hypothetical protein
MTRNDLMSAGLTRRQTLLAMLSATGLSATGLTACGGGSDLASVGVGGTGSFTSGRITGFGSIIVNGIRYEDSSADISSDDSAFRRQDLRLGMVVAVQGGPVVDGRSTATRIVLNGELLGPIGSKGVNSLVVLGQTVTISDSTVFAGVAGLDALNANDVVEVHGTADSANNSILASYVEKKVGVNDYRIQGRVTAHDANAKTFSLDTLQLNYSNTEEVRVTPEKDTLLRVRLGTTAASGVYPVIRISKPEDAFNAFKGEVEFKGTITSFTDYTSFTVNEVPVSVSGDKNASYPEGTDRIQAGAYVGVKGALVGGVLVATCVKLEENALAGNAGSEFELHGTISNAVMSDAGGSFRLTSSSGVSVDVEWSSGSVEFNNVTAVNLVSQNPPRVEVKGTLLNGNKVKASRISLES